jgi:hypothetical protein
MATYKHIRSATANKRPTTSIADGQLAINTNTASPGLFFKDSAGTGIVKVGPVHVGTTAPNSTPASGGSSGNYLGEQWLDTSVSPAQMKVWNGSAWVGVVADELPVSKLQDGTARQLIQTDAAGTGVEWTSNIDVPGTLDVTSTATFDSIARHPLGTAGAPTITFTGDTNTGIYSPGADQVAISTNGTQRLYIDSTGNIGVGTTTKAWETGQYFAIQFGKGGSVFGRATGDEDRNGFVSNAYATSTGWKYIASSAHATRYDHNDGNHIWYYAGTGTADASVTFSEAMRIDTSGRLGLGVSNPSQLLTVDGNGLFGTAFDTASTDGYGVRITKGGNYGAVTTQATSAATDATFAFRAYKATSKNFEVTCGGGGYFAGSVGIGTTSPSGKLTVDTKTAATNAVLIAASTETGRTYGLGVNASASFVIHEHTAASDRLVIDSSGRLLVGGTSSAFNSGSNALLQLSTGGTTGSSIQRTTTSSDASLGYLNFWSSAGECASISANTDGTQTASTASPGRLVFSTTPDGAGSPTPRMTITSAGRVNIGSISDRSKTLQVSSFAVSPNANLGAGNLLVDCSFTGAGGNTDLTAFGYGADHGGYRLYSRTGSGLDNTQIMFIGGNDHQVWIGYTSSNGSSYKLQVNSQIFATSATIATSDGRYKENVATLGGCLDLVKALRPVSFTWKPQTDITSTDEEGNEVMLREGHNFPEGTQVGFIAQEVQEVLADKPWLGSVIKENVRPAVKDEDGNELAPEEQFYGIAEGNLIAVLTNALQEAVAEIESLKARVTALEP